MVSCAGDGVGCFRDGCDLEPLPFVCVATATTLDEIVVLTIFVEFFFYIYTLTSTAINILHFYYTLHGHDQDHNVIQVCGCCDTHKRASTITCLWYVLVLIPSTAAAAVTVVRYFCSLLGPRSLLVTVAGLSSRRVDVYDTVWFVDEIRLPI